MNDVNFVMIFVEIFMKFLNNTASIIGSLRMDQISQLALLFGLVYIFLCKYFAFSKKSRTSTKKCELRHSWSALLNSRKCKKTLERESSDKQLELVNILLEVPVNEDDFLEKCHILNNHQISSNFHKFLPCPSSKKLNKWRSFKIEYNTNDNFPSVLEPFKRSFISINFSRFWSPRASPLSTANYNLPHKPNLLKRGG